MKRLFTQIIMLLLATTAVAQSEYYINIDGTKGGEALKTALHKLIKNHQQISYGSGSSSTWGAFYTTDAVVENGKRRVLDMYSGETRYFGSKGEAISGMNIEHSVAKSWWGGTKNNAYCDLHHLNPSDQEGNSRKSNFPLGELTSVSWDNGVTFVGKASIDGSSENAFEPCDEYKGDFARTYMYMFTCYQDLTWKHTMMNYEKSSYPTLKPWAVKLLLKWHKQDPVSEKEVNRNNAVYAIQGNRNPFVDYPQLADYVWGDSVNFVFHINGEVESGTGSGNDGEDTPTVNSWKTYLDENFDGSEMSFSTYESAGNYPWELSSKYKCAVATSYVNSTNNDATSWLLSPSFDLSKDSVATLSFDYVIRYCQAGKAAEHHQLLISNNYNGNVEDASWEIIDFNATENSTDWSFTKTGDIVLPATYMGKKNVTIAFYYKGTTTKAGTFEVDNVILKAIEGTNASSDQEEDNDDSTTGGSDNNGNGGNFNTQQFVLVTDAEQLTIGDTIIIAYENFAMGASAGNYRHKTDILTSNGTITYLADDVQKIVLEEGLIDGTFALSVSDGYLAASSSSSNYLATTATIDENGSWLITIATDALATIKAQGEKTRNTLQYNTSSPRFSCYKGTQKSVNIYAKSQLPTNINNPKGESTVSVYSLTGATLRTNVAPEKATEGLHPGIYIIEGRKTIVR